MSTLSGGLLVSPSSSFLSIPLVRRIEYLDEFLLGARDSGTMAGAEERLAAKKKFFELEKSKALGRGRPFMKKLEEAERLAEFCFTMTRQLGLVKTNLALSVSGMTYLSESEATKRSILIKTMLKTYSRFRQLLRALSNNESKELAVPMERGTGVYERALESIGL